jgi:hypothetical protein
MLQSVLFLLLLGLPLIIYVINAYLSQRDARQGMGGGFSGGIPRPKQAKAARASFRKARVRNAQGVNCGRAFSHLALTLVGSSGTCRYCSALEPAPPEPPTSGDAPVDDIEAAIRAAEEIIDQSRH